MRLKKYRYLLIPFSLVYFFLVSIRNIFYGFNIFKRYRLNAVVISIGNITWGGTGKTPLVLFIAQALLGRGIKSAVLIRGYGDDEKEFLSDSAGSIPVVAGKDRVKTGEKAVSRYSLDTLLIDDGFQYRRIERDIDIVCIDAMDPFGGGWLIPSGSMREPIGALKRADIFLLTKVDLVEEQKEIQHLKDRLKRLNPRALIAKSIHSIQDFRRLSDSNIVAIKELKDKDIVLVSAIGSPLSFEKTILKLGLKIKRHFVFRDHYCYSHRDLEEIEDYCLKHKVEAVVCTEKDAVKLRKILNPSRKPKAENRKPKILVLTIKLEIIENEKGFFDRLFRIYNS